MAQTIEDIDIINKALARLGANPIFALDEETSAARQAVAVYADRRDQLLGRHPWQFARRTYLLTEVAKTAANGWDATHLWGNGYTYAYAMPGDRLSTPRKVLPDPRREDFPLRQYLVEEGRIYADRAPPLYGTFTVRVAPQLWSPAFRLAAITLIAADLAVPITHDRTLAKDLREAGEGDEREGGLGGMVRQAINADVSGSPGPAPLQAADDLTSAHMS